MLSNVTYQSIRTSYAQPKKIPDNAKIAVEYFISPAGEILGIVYNLTDEIMILDQTKSFFVNTDGNSSSYFDPTVRQQSTTQISSGTTGASVNLGALANAFGVGGVIGSLLNGVNVGEAHTDGVQKTNTVLISDQPNVNIGPKGKIALSKIKNIEGITTFQDGTQLIDIKPTASPLKFSICITYSINNGESYDKLVTDFYVNSRIVVPIKNGEVNNAFNTIYSLKKDALAENLFAFKIHNNIYEGGTGFHLDTSSNPSNIFSNYSRGSLIDYK